MADYKFHNLDQSKHVVFSSLRFTPKFFPGDFDLCVVSLRISGHCSVLLLQFTSISLPKWSVAVLQLGQFGGISVAQVET